MRVYLNCLFPSMSVFWGCNFLLLCFKGNRHWYHLIQDAQKRGAIIKTCDKNYRHDAMKILKLKPLLQRSLTHPPAVAPEASRPQGGLPSSKQDGELSKTSFASSCTTHPLIQEATVTEAAKDPEGHPLRTGLRDPRLLRRMGLAFDAQGISLQRRAALGPSILEQRLRQARQAALGVPRSHAPSGSRESP